MTFSCSSTCFFMQYTFQKNGGESNFFKFLEKIFFKQRFFTSFRENPQPISPFLVTLHAFLCSIPFRNIQELCIIKRNFIKNHFFWSIFVISFDVRMTAENIAIFYKKMESSSYNSIRYTLEQWKMESSSYNSIVVYSEKTIKKYFLRRKILK